jgi:hypothetical protein
VQLEQVTDFARVHATPIAAEFFELFRGYFKSTPDPRADCEFTMPEAQWIQNQMHALEQVVFAGTEPSRNEFRDQISSEERGAFDEGEEEAAEDFAVFAAMVLDVLRAGKATQLSVLAQLMEFLSELRLAHYVYLELLRVETETHQSFGASARETATPHPNVVRVMRNITSVQRSWSSTL